MSQHHIFSIDVEENWMGEFSRKLSGIQRTYLSDSNISPTLAMLDEFGCKATFFIVGQCVSDSTLVRIAKAGHEIAFHTTDHVPLQEKNREQFRREIRDFRARVKDVTGSECIGFRAPSFSLSRKTSWATDILHEEGYKYDSSIFPVRTLLYNGTGAPLEPYQLDSSNPLAEGHSLVTEFPLTTYSVLHQGIPIAGGFYLRAVPLPFISMGLKRLERRWGMSVVLYVHNWEIVPGPPPSGIPFLSKFYISFNTGGVMFRVRHLLSRFRFTSFRDAYFNDGVEMLSQA